MVGEVRSLAEFFNTIGSRRLPAPPVLAERGSASKLHTRWSKLQELRALGRATADAWLDKSADQFRRSSILTDDDLPEAVAAWSGRPV